MRVLLDECVPRALRRELPDHDVKTVAEVGWAGLKNGELLQRATLQFDVLLTIDRNLEYQQNFAGLSLAVVISRLSGCSDLNLENIKVSILIKGHKVRFFLPMPRLHEQQQFIVSYESIKRSEKDVLETPLVQSKFLERNTRYSRGCPCFSVYPEQHRSSPLQQQFVSRHLSICGRAD
jgi:predicted nuclease of predicted toxin-antitoxin system